MITLLGWTGCGARTGIEDWWSERGGAPGHAGAPGLPTETPRVCVFDYDLTLSSNGCSSTQGSAHSCRTNVCITYNWYPQCLGAAARAAVAECVRRGAFIGVASHASVDACWSDKVTPILSEQQFPELTNSPRYANPNTSWSYPAIDDRANWNCENCAYTMDGGVSKPAGIRRILRHYGLNPDLASDRRRVIFWDDEPRNVDAVRKELPEARSILVPRFGPTGNSGGCGITTTEIDAGWAE